MIFCALLENMKKLQNWQKYVILTLFWSENMEERKKTKLEASIDRMEKLSRKIKTFSPDIVISFCSPEAARISFGLGIRHVAFCDSPHADAVMRLTLPLIQKLLIPNVIPKNKFSKYGIDKKSIVSYKAIDAAVTIKRKINQKASLPFKTEQKKKYFDQGRRRRGSICIKIKQNNSNY